MSNGIEDVFFSVDDTITNGISGSDQGFSQGWINTIS